MKKIIFLIITNLIAATAFTQFVHKIKADSVLITNDSCTAELNLENSTKAIKGFLYNYGNGRTRFQKGLIKINGSDTLYLIGADTLRIPSGLSKLFAVNGLTKLGDTVKLGGDLIENTNINLKDKRLKLFTSDATYFSAPTGGLTITGAKSTTNGNDYLYVQTFNRPATSFSGTSVFTETFWQPTGPVTSGGYNNYISVHKSDNANINMSGLSLYDYRTLFYVNNANQNYGSRYHFYAGQPLGNNPIMTNNVGLYVEPLKRTTVANAYAIYSAGTEDSIYNAGPVRWPKYKNNATEDSVLTTDINGNIKLKIASGGGSSNGWNLTGNTGTNSGINFLGTIDNTSLRFRTNNIERMRIDSVTGAVTIPYGGGGGAMLNISHAGYGTGGLSVNNNAGFYTELDAGRLNLRQGEYGVNITGNGLISPYNNDIVFTAYQGRENLRSTLYGGIVVNNLSDSSVHFHVKSKNNPNLFLANAYTDNVGIGTTSPHSSSILDITSTTKGFLLPRMTAAQRLAISSPATSLFVWDTDSLRYMGHNGTAWKGLKWADEGGGSGSGNGWSLTGNLGTNSATNFLGTTDNISLRIRTNNIQRAVIDSNGRVGINRPAPAYQLDVNGDARISTLPFLANRDTVLTYDPATKQMMATKVNAAPTSVKLTADLPINTAIALTNATGLSFPVTANTYYHFKFLVVFSTAATTTGIRLSISTPASPAILSATASIPIAADGAGGEFQGWITASDDVVIGTGVQAINTNYMAIVEGTILTGAAAGTVQLRYGSEIAGSGVTIRRASLGQLTIY
jgi:hypothetical protein